MKTKNKSVKRKLSFNDNIEAHWSGERKKTNVGSSTTIASVQMLPDEQGSSSKPQHSFPIASHEVASCVPSLAPIDYQQCTPAKDVTHVTTCTNGQADVYVPDDENMHITSSALATTSTNDPYNMQLPHGDYSSSRYRHSRAQFRRQSYLNTHELRPANSIPLEYMHMGRCTCVCRYCGATFWENEKKNVHSTIGGLPVYNRCCHGGRVVLRPPPEYPQYIRNLYADAHFMENIRAYNQMFNMTSLGANIDSSINNGKGPYVFRISGQIYHWIRSMCPPKVEAPRFLQLYIYDTQNEVRNRMSHFGGEYDSGLKRDIMECIIDFLDNHNVLVQLFRTARIKQQEVNVPELKVKLYNVVGTR